jgi:hypothetical protein
MHGSFSCGGGGGRGDWKLITPKQILMYNLRVRSVRYSLLGWKDQYTVFPTSWDATSERMHHIISKGLLKI